MPSEDRVCKNCGTLIPVGMRNCPKCNRLFIDSSRERLYSSEMSSDSSASSDERGTPMKAVPPKPASAEPIEQVDSTGQAPEKSGGTDGGAKTDSYYGVAPISPPSGQEQTASYPGAPSGVKEGCRICALLLVVTTFAFHVIALLL